MICRCGLFYYEIIKRLENLEKKDNELNKEFIKIVDRYQNKFNKSIFI
tara:strand:+ start:141 stop:284 length:144 start_codon:yes stop_codon:yes gene_type:complete